MTLDIEKYKLKVLLDHYRGSGQVGKCVSGYLERVIDGVSEGSGNADKNGAGETVNRYGRKRSKNDNITSR